MDDKKQEIIKNLCYTDLVYGRINKKLSTNFPNAQVELFIDKVLKKTDKKFYKKIGKNYYVTNSEDNVRITINSNTFRVITVDKLVK
ncbi:DUF3781 domain-containing protein [Formosa algae]|uniref:DUF3781 domain-containing protein n=1 Tax=Formosa algae TaxID=225843 RepID=A0A9X0YKG3_9FLAO|nr:hypothetical protein [Formosa algae]MDQ0336353.1 hypothetical protein [Formosa algae]OEI78763.1 hypothetical protein AST99_17990 [Formosa algae]